MAFRYDLMKPKKLVTNSALHLGKISRVLLVAAFFLSLPFFLFAQENSIANGNITTCGGFLVDSGLSASDYGANENFTATICPQAPETIINLYWSVCDLGSGDVIEIFDGPNTASPLIGTYTFNDLQTQDITSTNAAGCLTIHFTSNGADEGNFGAEISCGPPCVRPITNITSDQEPMPLLICPGETVTFDGSGTTFFNGSSLGTFSWNFDDGSNNTSSWPSVTHTFNEPGGYKVQLTVVDDNDCQSTNLNDYVVLVSTAPNFNLITDITDLCSGGTAFLGVTNIAQDSIFSSDSLSNWISEPWIDLPDNFYEEGYHVDDDQTQCYDVYFTYNGFPAGEIIDDVSDIVYAYINFEHSFIQDLVISVICPTGETVILHQQTGGGTDVGEPVAGVDTGAGVGWDYFWSPDATNGTWGDNIGTGVVPSGTYESVQPFDNLIGCPLNGTWTIEFCDMWGGDDGTLFNYGIAFDPSLYGEVLSFTPNYGPGCDSTYWTGAGIVSQSSGCDYINVELTNPGTYDFVYTAINDFGCSFDTTIAIVVDVAPEVTAGPDFTMDCTAPQVFLDGGLADFPEASCNTDGGIFNYTYNDNDNFSWTFCPDAGAQDYTVMTFGFISGQMENIFEDFVIYDGPDNTWPIMVEWDLGDATGQSWTATNETGCITFAFTADFTVSAATGDFEPWTYEVGCEQIEPEFVYSWTPAQNLADATDPDSEVINLSATQTFVLTGYPVGQPNCFSTDEVTVTVNNSMSIDVEEFYNACLGDTVHVLAPQITGGLEPYSITWESTAGEMVNQDDFLQTVDQSVTFCAMVEDFCGLRDTACTDITPFPIIMASFQVDAPFGCDPLPVLMVSDYTEYQNVASMVWNFGDGQTGFTMASSNHIYETPGVYTPSLTITDENGCEYTDSIASPVIVWPTPVADFVADPSIAILPSTTFDFTNQSIDGDHFNWTFDALGTSEAFDTTYTFPYEISGQYLISLFATNQFGCTDSTSMYVMVQDDIDIYIPNAFTPDGDGINDIWQVKGSGFVEQAYHAVIFNRWGEKMFETTDPEAVWTGNYNNGEWFVPDGVYHYRITIRDKENEVGHEYEGHITIVR